MAKGSVGDGGRKKSASRSGSGRDSSTAPDRELRHEQVVELKGKTRVSKPAVRSRGFAGLAEAKAYLYDRVDVERSRPNELGASVFRLDRMHAIMACLGDPHRDMKFVHVAGSKGKGSTCEMIASCLEACGYATGLYTSPHLVDLRERVRINGREISEEDFVDAASKVARAIAPAERKHGPATFFELLTALGFLHFAEQAVDVAVIEVGLGGRLDSTNVILPEVCAVTAIQLEHTKLLGDTVEKIAGEKAGIFKKGVPVITFQQKPGIMKVFRDKAEEIGSPLSVLGETVDYSARFEATPDLGPHYRVCVTTPRSNFEHLPVPLKGEHQAVNCGIALAVLDKLRERGFETPERHVAKGLARTPNSGRLELVWKRPRIIVDGAHTPDSVHQLVRACGAHLKYDNLIVVFGCAADKDVPGMLTKLAGGADKIVFTKAEHHARAADPRDLQRKFAEVSGKMTQGAATVKDALNLAHKAAGREDLICVTGSFYVAGEAKRLLAERAKSATV